MFDKDFRSKAPELLVDLATQAATTLQEIIPITQEQAEHAGREIAQRLASHWGGQNIYFPMGLPYRLSQRDRQIYADFNGHNHSELVQKYGMSLQWIYKIVKAVRAEEIADRQRPLFDDQGEK